MGLKKSKEDKITELANKMIRKFEQKYKIQKEHQYLKRLKKE